MSESNNSESVSSADYNNAHESGKLKPKDKLYCYTISILEQQITFLREEIVFLREQLEEKGEIKDSLASYMRSTTISSERPVLKEQYVRSASGTSQAIGQTAHTNTGQMLNNSGIGVLNGTGGRREWDTSLGDQQTDKHGWTDVKYRKRSDHQNQIYKKSADDRNKNNLTCTAGRFQTLPVEPCSDVLCSNGHNANAKSRSTPKKRTKNASRTSTGKPQENRPIIRPGKETYNRAHINKLAVISDSMMGGIKEIALNETLQDTEATVEKHPGAKSKQISFYTHFLIQEEKPNTVVIHAGTNDLNNKKKKDANNQLTDEEIASNIIGSGLIARDNGVGNILISSIIVRRGMYFERRRNKINKMLREQYLQQGFQYVDNNNIRLQHLGYDGVHLKPEGTKVLFDNLVENLSIPVFNDSNFSSY